ncbi:5'-nucleotidase C-terminal domain-containing protein [Actinobaculum sp. 352]|uniref:5'-nucleotidase C-terminal domain-containing protein n=1 Tax=Actinobaculum sp. 352 TaxID=2490946 RepID=UPI000F7F0899|nr:5'-nucleotidase C-terminal domain-containing protein [Actinobaculum sp. 352]RTE48993.1 bifunctional metallophosphatase/5'-nucleotidase [Actinobaculum sp. 352]
MKHSRLLLAALAAGTLTVSPQPIAAADEGDSNLTILATTDIHGHVFNWDYFRDAPYPQGSTPELGMARVDTIVDNVRNEKGAQSVLVVDNGDAVQGTPLTYLAAMQPDKLPYSTNPMAEAFNTIGYDVQVVGNHEFNYGMDYLYNYERQLNFPLLGANVVKAGTNDPVFKPYVMVDKEVNGKTVKVGVLGVVTPGVRVWDKHHVQGVLEFRDCVLTAQQYVPQIKAEGADVVVVLIHSGLDAPGVPWDASLLQENVAESLSTKVNDVDVVVGGHSHVVNKASVVYHAPDGDPVLFTQPYVWARSVSEVTVPLEADGDGFRVAWPETDAEIGALAVPLETKDVADSPDITGNAVLTADHAATIEYVNTTVSTSTEELSAATSYYEDTPILDYIGMVQTETVANALKGTEHEGIPVLSQVSPFSRTAVFPQGNVTIKDIAGLYIYENTLLGVKLTGAQIKEYLEYSARYFVQVEEGATFDPETGVNALYPGATRGIMDYNYDALTGVDYLIDVSKPVGERIVGLSRNGVPVVDDDVFILAINNYRQGGGGNYPHVVNAPIVYDETQEIRQLIIDRASADGVIDPANFFVDNWALVTSTPNPTVTLSADNAKVGDEVTATLSGFVPNRAVAVSLHSDPVEVAKVTTDGAGAASVSFEVPTGVAAGEHTVVVTQSPLKASAKLTVAARANAKPSASASSGSGSGGSGATASTGASGSGTGKTGSEAGGKGATKVRTGTLARTGADTQGLVAVALFLMISGGMLAARRRVA